MGTHHLFGMNKDRIKIIEYQRQLNSLPEGGNLLERIGRWLIRKGIRLQIRGLRIRMKPDSDAYADSIIKYRNKRVHSIDK